ncbi:TnsA-like heteromeric transposase endonuclease subunit [Micromonospora sp. NBC_01412]|uniref:TnsA-like heteromeric transposase endonuclease subunit n=1 Tax=Micromonospora sp. NBC_01412 TaxID=2903590 RepID=UPI003252806E
MAYVGSDGVRQRGPLTLRWSVPFERAGAVRRFTSRQGQRSFSGLWYFASSGDHVGYESWLERDRLMALDADPDVVAVASQPFWLCWDGPGERPLRHAPDFFVRRRDGTAVVVDVRADDRIRPNDAVKFAATARACGAVGWGYERVGALDSVLAANLRWLSGHRHQRYHQPDRADRLRQVFARPTVLMEGVTVVADPLGVLPVLFHLLWRRELQADLRSEPLSENSLVRVAGGFR